MPLQFKKVFSFVVALYHTWILDVDERVTHLL